MKDQRWRREVELRSLAVRDEMSRVRAEADSQMSAYCEDKKRLERQLQTLDDVVRREGERARDDYRRQTEELERRLQEARGELMQTRQQ